MFPVLVIAYLVCFLLVATSVARNEGYWSPVVLFGICAFYYYVSIPVELYLHNEEVFTTYPRMFLIDPAQRSLIAAAAIIALIGFVAGHRASGLGALLSTPEDTKEVRIPRALWAPGLGAVFLLVAIYRGSLFERLSYADAIELRYEDFVYSFLMKWVLTSIGCFAAVQIQRGPSYRWSALAMLAPMVFWGFYTSDKDPMLLAGISYSVVWLGRASRSPFYLAFFCGSAAVAVMCLPIFSLYRTGVPITLETVAERLTLLRGDAYGPLISLSVATEPDQPWLYGSSYANATVAWVPRFVWPGRPMSIDQRFALEHIRDWKAGQGLGFSLLAEGYMNFGLVGVGLQYFVIAFGVGRVWVALRPMFVERGCGTFWRSLLVLTYFQLLVMMHRAPTLVVVQSQIHLLTIPVLLLPLLDKPRRASEQERSPPPRAPHRVPGTVRIRHTTG